MRILAWLLSAILLASSPALQANEPPRAQKSEYLLSTGAGFLMQVDGDGAAYGMTFELRKKVRKPLHAVVTFENPADPESPFVVEETIARGQRELRPGSPRFTEAHNGRIYQVRVDLYEDASKEKRLGSHVQGVLFSVPEALAPRLGVTLK